MCFGLFSLPPNRFLIFADGPFPCFFSFCDYNTSHNVDAACLPFVQGIPDDLVFSFPVKCGGAGGGGYEIVGGRAISDGLRSRLNATAQELQEERKVALAALSKL